MDIIGHDSFITETLVHIVELFKRLEYIFFFILTPFIIESLYNLITDIKILGVPACA